MATHKVKLEICGSSYVVSTNDSEEYLLGLAERLDRDMNQLMLEAPNASVAAAAVITALSYLDNSEKNAQGADNMRTQIKDYLEDASKARLMAEDYKRENERLRRELNSLQKKMADGHKNHAAKEQAAENEELDGQIGIKDI